MWKVSYNNMYVIGVLYSNLILDMCKCMRWLLYMYLVSIVCVCVCVCVCVS